MLTDQQRKEKIGDVFRVASGNFLEQYDFFVFGYYAKYIGETFFPSTNPTVSLLNAFATFAVGFFMRPLGAIFLGAYIDRVGRRVGLILTLALMAIGTLTIALTPGYASIGIAAPLIIIFGRLLQGFSAGVELGGVSIYLAEIATPGNKGFYCAWQSGSQQVAVVFASLLGFALSQLIAPADMSAWGWRIPLLIGCLIIPLIYYFRRSLKETEAFASQKKHPTPSEIGRIMVDNWKIVLTGALLSTLTTTTFYLITAYTPTFGKEVLKFTLGQALMVTCVIGLSNLFWLPVGGALSDRIGRRPMMLAISGVAIFTAYPALSWLVSETSMTNFFIVELWFSAIFGLYNGAMIPFLADMMPFKVRTTGFSLAFSLAAALFGGVTPLVSTYLIEHTGNKASPSLWLMLAAVLAFGASLYARRYDSVTQPEDLAAAAPAE